MTDYAYYTAFHKRRLCEATALPRFAWLLVHFFKKNKPA